MPEPVWPSSWELGPDFIPKDRYLSREFLDLELEKLWPRVWQVACREEQIPDPGSYIEYEIGDQPFLIVRSESGDVKAFHNACRHRGRRLASGCGRFEGRTIRCAFHGWSWKLDGTNSHVFMPEQFTEEALESSNLRLRECRVAHWAGFVFINMDPDAPSLEETIAPATRWLDPVAIDRMGVLWHKVAILPINWKGAFDAFHESYHVLTTHPEYKTLGTDANAFRYYTDPGGHHHYAVPPTTDNPPTPGVDPRVQFHDFIAYNVKEIGAMYTARDEHVAARIMQREVPDGSNAAVEFTKELYAYAEGAGVPLPTPTSDDFAHVGINYVFPHLMFLPTLGNALCYRSRPNGLDPESTIWDVWSLTIFPDDQAPPPYETQYVDWRDEKQVGRVLFQDFTNMYETSVGMKSRSFEGMRLNKEQEMGLLHVQQEIDRYLKD
jgi:phenylpropionate dioxygenase-like ring-hydroxylating dioxygenase large terminal subunit